MTTANARDAVKKRLHIGIAAADTTYDATIDQFVLDVVKQLWPRAAYEEAGQLVTITPDDGGQASVELSTLPTPLAGFRLIEGDDGSGEWPLRQTYQHGTKVRIRGLTSDTTKLHIYGLNRFTLTTLYEELELAVVYLAVAEFYNFLVGDEREYNAYMQNGRPAVEVMKELADSYTAKAEVIIEEKATMYGR